MGRCATQSGTLTTQFCTCALDQGTHAATPAAGTRQVRGDMATGLEEDDALLAADFEAEREMDAEREMEAATRDEAEASGGLGTAAARAASDKKQTKAW